jgi:preprotein translocase subunit SecF
MGGGNAQSALAKQDGDTQIALAKLQYEYELKRLELEQQHELKSLELQNQVANFGLQGTLWGTWAALGAIVLIALVQIFFNRYVVQGFAFATMVGTIAIPVALYGAFIYNRSLSLAAKMKSGEFSAKT